jgi:CRISPR-associated endonuclease/helicase Cas3
LEDYWYRAQDQAQKAVETAGVPAPVASTTAAGLHALFPKHAQHDHDPTPLQQHAIECPIESGPQLFILEDATGSGKTEGAVILTHRLMQQGEAEGTYVGLPTMATANAMHERLTDTYRLLFENGAAASYVLAHSAREHVGSFQDTLRLEDPASDSSESYDTGEEGEQTGQAECAAWLADNRKKALLANVGVGTIDQALIGTLPSRHQSLRLLGLGRSVLVVDEVHAYDEYVSSLLRHVLRFQAAMGGSAVLLSATLPETLRQKLCDAFRQGLPDGERDTVEEDHFPLVTHVGPDGRIEETPIARSERSEHHLDVEFFEAEKGAEKDAQKRVSEKLLDVARKGGCACWIRTTVDDAINAWEHLREQHDHPDKVLLFHARFTLGDRQKKEARVLRHFGEESGPDDRSGYILVATQVVEQSLDLDFDYMVSDLAPIDLLIQRAGRLHRHDRDARPDGASDAMLGILAPAFSDAPPGTWYADLFPKGKFVYPHAGHLWRTMKVLKEKGRIHIPEEARSLLDAVYREADLQHPTTQDDDPEWGIPGGLLKTSNKAINKAKKASAEANHNALHLDGGYGSLKAGGREWFSEKRTPTRLGDPTTTVRLARWDGDRLVPWADDGNELDTLHEELEALRKTSDENGWNEERTKRAREIRRHMADLWQRSELTVRESKISEEESLSGYKVARKRAVGAAKEGMPDGGKWSVLTVVERGVDNWTGHANKGHQKRALTYTEDAGLQFDK